MCVWNRVLWNDTLGIGELIAWEVGLRGRGGAKLAGCKHQRGCRERVGKSFFELCKEFKKIRCFQEIGSFIATHMLSSSTSHPIHRI